MKTTYVVSLFFVAGTDLLPLPATDAQPQPLSIEELPLCITEAEGSLQIPGVNCRSLPICPLVLDQPDDPRNQLIPGKQ